MHRFLSSLFRERSTFNPRDETEVEDSEDLDQHENTEALHELHATYNAPRQQRAANQSGDKYESKNIVSMQKQREMGLISFRRTPSSRHRMMDRYLPEEGEVVASMAQSAFCGQFSEDGQCFISASQDFTIHLFDTSSSKKFEKITQIELEDVGWAILDTAVSPDRSSIAYSTWSPFLYMVQLNDTGNKNTVTSLNLRPNTDRFSIFSLQYSADGSEIIGGSNDRCVYIYDLHRHTRTLQVPAHRNDVNAVRFADDSNSLILSGSDDGLVLVWDRRALNEANPKPVGYFAGHSSGITFVHSRMDTRYLISNSKDQTIKLWDMRRFADQSAVEQCLKINSTNERTWDYRVGPHPRSFRRGKITGDPSVQTYRGHSVAFTLIRCYFSPSFTTGQRYIITGSSDGFIYIYDVLTGEIERRLSIRKNHYGSARERCIRDVSWHPYEPYIVSTSWDDQRAHVRWTHRLNSSHEPILSPPIESKSRTIQAPPTPPFNEPISIDPITLQRFLIEQLLAGSYSDEDNSSDE